MRRRLLLIIGVVAVSLALLMVVGTVALPRTVERILQPIPVKFLLSQIGLALIFIAALFAYWSFQLPKTARVALGLLRVCLGIATASVATPFSFFGLQSLSVAINQKATINITCGTSFKPAFVTGTVAIVIAYFALREYRSARIYEHAHGISAEI